jgi:hypothetical protein
VLARVFRLDAETRQVKAGEEWSTSSLQSPDDLEAIYQKKRGTELEFVIMVIAVSCVKLLSAHNSTQHTSRKHKV